MEHMVLEATSTEAGLNKFLVVGTSINRGEDMSSKGNVSVIVAVKDPSLTPARRPMSLRS